MKTTTTTERNKITLTPPVLHIDAVYVNKERISFDDIMFENVDVNFEHTDFGAGKLSFYKSWLDVIW